MKRILLSILLVFTFTPSFAQGVQYIKLTDDRWEFMTTEESFTLKGQTNFGVSLQVYNEIKESNPEARLRFFLILSYQTYDQGESIPAGGKLLMRTGKDEVFNFVNDVEGDILAYSPTSGFSEDISRHQYVSGSYSSYYINRGKYELTKDEVKKLATDGVVKIRIETNGESIDINLPATEQIKIGKERQNINKFAFYFMKMLLLSDKIFNPIKDF